MLPKDLSNRIETEICGLTGRNEKIEKIRHGSGGCINNAVHIITNYSSYFLKYNDAAAYPGMFEKEKKGLELLAQPGVIDVAIPLLSGEIKRYSFLLLEYINSSSQINNYWTDFGHKLAELHKITNENYGLDHDNYIGSLYQKNTMYDNWCEFFINERLEPQVKLAFDNQRADRKLINDFSALYNRLPDIFPDENPALLHGDLWGGNHMVSATGRACLIDPAVYFGHREMDIGMTLLFGGFREEFYSAYNESYPMQGKWRSRVDLCNLYPLLVHVNLFGGSYLYQVMSCLKQYN